METLLEKCTVSKVNVWVQYNENWVNSHENNKDTNTDEDLKKRKGVKL